MKGEKASAVLATIGVLLITGLLIYMNTGGRGSSAPAPTVTPTVVMTR